MHFVVVKKTYDDLLTYFYIRKKKKNYVAHDMKIASLKDYEMHKTFKGKNYLFCSSKEFFNNKHRYMKVVDVKGEIY